MRRILPILVMLIWALWFGGIVMLFLLLGSLFATLERSLAGLAASTVIRRFEVFQLVLSAAALLTMLGWRTLTSRSRLKTAMLIGFAVATVLVIASAAVLSPMIEGMRARGETGSGTTFGLLHGISSLLYLTKAVVLLVIGVLLPATIARTAALSSTDAATPTPRESTETGPATAPA